MRAIALLGLMFLTGTAAAQGAGDQAREVEVLMSRYEQALGKFERQNERFQSDIRALQRQVDEMGKSVEAANGRSQGVADEMQRLQNTDIVNVKEAQRQLTGRLESLKEGGPLWGEGQRDCKDIGVKHQQLKVTVKPDGTRGVRYLCFDGKALHLGSEVYVVE